MDDSDGGDGRRNRPGNGPGKGARPTPLEGLRESNLAWSRRASAKAVARDAFTRQSWTLPRSEARAKAREFLDRYPRAAYATEVESSRVLPGDIIEFTMRRLPTAD